MSKSTERLQPLLGKVALITGAGRGIGRAIAQAYADAGATVCCAARTLDQVREVASEIETRGGRAIGVVVDVTDKTSLDNCAALCQEHFGGVDLLVVNAGSGGRRALVGNADVDDWRHTVEVNLVGAFLTVQTILPLMHLRGGGHIIMIGSGAGRRPAKGMSAYATSKAALWMLTRTLALELSDKRILVNELIPGPVRTDMLGDRGAEIVAHAGVEWLKTPEDVTPLAMFLATLPGEGPTGQSFSLCRRDI